MADTAKSHSAPHPHRDDTFTADLELNPSNASHLANHTVRSFSWQNITATVGHRDGPPILSSVHGYVEAGEVLAIMGPSGSGKSTLLNALAHRTMGKIDVDGQVLANGQPTSWDTLRHISSYVEQEDALIGSLTVRETMDFAARLALPSSMPKWERKARIDGLLDSFGIAGQAKTIVGTPIRKGISGGQKRRLSVASQLVTDPKILFLDEPTSGLDSTASFEVMSYIRELARKSRLIVIASIHQPSAKTFQEFDRLLLLSTGKTCYFGAVAEVPAYFGNLSYPIPVHMNPSEFLLDLVNVDFAKEKDVSQQHLDRIHESWNHSEALATVKNQIETAMSSSTNEKPATDLYTALDSRSSMLVPFTLLHRSWIKSYRDIIAYGIRIAMYTGLAIMMGTVWLRLNTTQTSIQPFINAIFFGSAFMSFMAVAYVPSIIEDLHTFKKERANGLYGPLAFTVSNFLIGIPYLFLISVIFSVIAYWLSNFRPTAGAFWTWVMWLFLDLLAAEGLVVLVTIVAPIFVVSLAVTAFANGLWMSVGGFLVPMGSLNVFWKYVFHYIDYQAYVFQGMMVNEFEKRIYDCAVVPGASGGPPQYQCMYSSDLQSEGKIRGTAVLEAYKYSTDRTGEWVGILIAIIVVYRILGCGVLWVRRS